MLSNVKEKYGDWFDLRNIEDKTIIFIVTKRRKRKLKVEQVGSREDENVK